MAVNQPESTQTDARLSDEHRRRRVSRGCRSLPWPFGVAVVAVAVAFLAIPALAGVPARLIEGCAKWIALSGVLEALSVLGFIVVFKLVFGAWMTWRESSLAGLRALGASTILPAGGLVGPAAGVWPAGVEKVPRSRLTRSTVAFVLLTNASGAIVLGALGVSLWLGWPRGPHQADLTLLPAVIALAIVAAGWRVRPSPAAVPYGHEAASRQRAVSHRLGKGLRVLRDGVADTNALVAGGSWKLLGALGYYAFDNAVLWAAFHAYGGNPPLSVVMMGYLVGSVAAALPTPAGVGAVEGGLIGALVLYGVPAAPAAAAVLLYRGISLSLPLLLGGLAWSCVPVAWLRSRLPTRARGDVTSAVATSPAAVELAPRPTPEQANTAMTVTSPPARG